MAIKAMCLTAGATTLGLSIGLLAVAAMCKQPQPIIILNAPIQNN